jgi:hypothetical protein
MWKNLPSSNGLESAEKGLLHDKPTAELRFLVCLYLAVKYFFSIDYPVSFEEINGQRTEATEVAAEQFEASLFYNILKYQVYLPTLYEIADDYGDKLSEEDVRDLVILYAANPSFSGMKLSELYSYYRSRLRAQPITAILAPLFPPPSASPPAT